MKNVIIVGSLVVALVFIVCLADQQSDIQERTCLKELQNTSLCRSLKASIKPGDTFDQETYMANSEYELHCIRPCKE